MLLRFPLARGRRLSLALALIAVTHPGWAQSAATLSLQEAVVLASSHAADAETSRAAIQSALEMAVAGRQLPDPVLKVGINNVPVDGQDRFSIGTESMTMRSISLMQELTRSAKREARARRFEAEASSAQAQRTTALTAVQRGAAQAWLDRLYAERATAVLAEQAQSIGLMIEAARAAYRGNRGPRTDILTAELELQQLRDWEDEARAAVSTARAMLQRWVGDAAGRPLGERPTLAMPAWLAKDRKSVV